MQHPLKWILSYFFAQHHEPQWPGQSKRNFHITHRSSGRCSVYWYAPSAFFEDTQYQLFHVCFFSIRRISQLQHNQTKLVKPNKKILELLLSGMKPFREDRDDRMKLFEQRSPVWKKNSINREVLLCAASEAYLITVSSFLDGPTRSQPRIHRAIFTLRVDFKCGRVSRLRLRFACNLGGLLV